MVSRLLSFLTLSAWLCQSLFAHDETITSFSVTNYTGYVIASDALNGTAGYDRDAIRTSVTVRYDATGTTSSNQTYHIVFRLLDSLGAPVQILDENGHTNTSFTVTNSITLPFTIFGTTFTSWTESYGGPLTPVARLDPYSQYTAEVRLYEAATKGFVATGDVATDGPRTYYDFQSTTSADFSANVIAVLNNTTYDHSYLVKTETDPGKNQFSVDAQIILYRYDAFASPVTTGTIAFAVDLEMRDAATDELIPLANSRITFSRTIDSYQAGSPNTPKVRVLNEVLLFAPAAGVQLNSVDKLYKVKVSLSHVEFLIYGSDNSMQMAARRFLHFNGNLNFGVVQTTFTSIANDPAFVSVVPGSYVATTLAVDGNSGSLVGDPAHTYGAGVALNVHLRPDGTSDLTSGSVALNGPAPDDDSVANVHFTRSNLYLDTAGAHGNITVDLPTGFGYRFDASSRILSSQIAFSNIPLTPTLEPANDQVYTATIYGAEETKPVWLEIARTTWKIASGQFILDSTSRAAHVRALEYAQLEAATVIDPAMKVKRSNDEYFRAIEKVTVPQIILEPDANGNAVMTYGLSFVGGGYRAHFPYDAKISFAGGKMDIKKDLVIPATSSLGGVSGVDLSYNRDCNDVTCPGAVGATTLNFKADADTLTFTEDGGLTRPGLLSTAAPLDWGWISAVSRYAHATENFTAANFHMPGLFVRGDRTIKALALRPAVILFTGVLPATPEVTERPGAASYQDGFGDYGGLNFRVGTDAALKAESTLANKPTGQYPLTGRSKYYVRQAGVSGIHEAVFGSFPSSATLLGYPINFSNFGLAFLDSQNTDSRTEGYIHIKSPSNFDQNFKKLLFTCLGALDKAEVPSDESGLMKQLQYWQADFTTLAIDFKSDAACNPGNGFLVLGVGAWASHVDSELFGQLGFKSDGNLITQDDGLVSDVTSRLKLPNTFKLKGPSKQKYTFTTVGDAYYNNYKYDHDTGWINIAGKLDVPFFEDLKVHMHTSAVRSNDTAVIHLMGGWPSHGFEISGKNYFNQTPFDTDNRGFPTDTTVAAYHTGGIGSDAEKYLVRAQRNWLGVIDFDYPLSWSSSLRSFKSFQPITDKFLVVQTEHQVKYLDAENAELTFGIEYEGMPKINIANLAFNAIDESTGVLQAFANAGLSTVESNVFNGLDKMNQMLDDQMRTFFNAPFDALIKPKIEAMYDELHGAFSSVSNNWSSAPNTIIQNWVTGGGPVTETVEHQLNGVAGSISDVTSVIGQVDSDLSKVEKAITDIESILAKTDGHRTIATQLIKSLVGELAADFVGSFTDDKLNEFLATVDPTLDQITDVLNDLKSLVSTLRTQLGAGQQFAKELQDKVAGLSADIHTVSVQVQSDIQSIFNGFDLTVDNPFVHYSKQEVVDLIRQKLEDRFFASKVPTTIQVALKERLYDIDSSIREAIDSVFQQVNDIMKNVISETLASLDDSIAPMLDKVSDVMGAGKINGYAHINNDALKLLRLDIYAQLKVPSEMELNAYIQIKELDSENYPLSCLPASGKATEVTMGATDVHVDWISPDLRANIGFKATFDTSSGVKLLGVGGSFELNGEVDFETFKIKYLAASMAFGEFENYFSCAARVEIQSYEGMGGIFFGKTCTLDPISMWDPDVASALGTPPFTGAYVYAEVWIPISEALLGIPASCFFDISAGVGAGAFYFVEGPTFGGKMLLGAHGDLLCIVSVGGEIKLIGVKNPDGLTLTGTGEVEGSIGPCPFCISFSKTIGMKYKNGSWDVDF